MSDIIDRVRKLRDNRNGTMSLISDLNGRGQLHVRMPSKRSDYGYGASYNLEEYVSADCVKEIKNLLINDLGAQADFYSSKLTEIEASLANLLGDDNEEI